MGEFSPISPAHISIGPYKDVSERRRLDMRPHGWDEKDVF